MTNNPPFENTYSENDHKHDFYVGVCVLRFETSWVTSLKEKRSLVKPIVEKLKNRFPVSVSRIDGLENHTWEVIGMCAISHNPTWLAGMLSKASQFASDNSNCRVFEISLDIEHW